MHPVETFPIIIVERAQLIQAGFWSNVYRYEHMAVKVYNSTSDFVVRSNANARRNGLRGRQMCEGVKIPIPKPSVFSEMELQALAGPDIAPAVLGRVVDAAGVTKGFCMPFFDAQDPLLFSPADKLALAVAMDDLVTRLHAKGIVHGDVKLSNFLSTNVPSFQAWLCDFGSAQRISTSYSPFQSTSRFVSPARLKLASGKVMPLCIIDDNFALVMSIWQLFAGQVPFYEVVDDEDAENLIEAGQLSDLEVVPAERGLRALVDRYWQEGQQFPSAPVGKT
jgi:hypothetical protein